MGSKSSSKSSSTNQSLNVAMDDIENSSPVVNTGANAQITTTDHGAIEASADLAFESLENQYALSESALSAMNEQSARTTAAMQSVSLSAQSDGQSVVADSLVSVFRPFLLVILALVAIVIVIAIYKGLKK